MGLSFVRLFWQLLPHSFPGILLLILNVAYGHTLIRVQHPPNWCNSRAAPQRPRSAAAQNHRSEPIPCPRLLYLAPLERPGQSRLSPPSFRLQRLDQQQHFGGFFIVQARILGEGAVAAAGGDRLEGCEEGELVFKIRFGGELLEEGC